MEEGRKENPNLKRYFTQMTKGRFYPRNEYEHAAYLVDSRKDEDSVIGFSEIVDIPIQLTNIGNDHLMRLEQNSAELLVHFLDMARREDSIKPLFLRLYHGWRASLLLTKTKDGAERKQQAAVGTSYIPRELLRGYGSDLSYLGPETKDEDSGNFLKKLFGGRKKKRPW